MSVILSLTGISIFVRINLWMKMLLHLLALLVFTVILINNCSVYQILTPEANSGRHWISNIGFDPILSHFYYVFMIVIILCIIDRQIEYIFRLDFKLSKRLKEEEAEAKLMGEINEMVIKNILPGHVVNIYLNQTLANTGEVYSESYKFCAVMFASIPNYSEFYSENIINDKGRTCLKVLNEIISDFDQVSQLVD